MFSLFLFFAVSAQLVSLHSAIKMLLERLRVIHGAMGKVAGADGAAAEAAYPHSLLRQVRRALWCADRCGMKAGGTQCRPSPLCLNSHTCVAPNRIHSPSRSHDSFPLCSFTLCAPHHANANMHTGVQPGPQPARLQHGCLQPGVPHGGCRRDSWGRRDAANVCTLCRVRSRVLHPRLFHAFGVAPSLAYPPRPNCLNHPPNRSTTTRCSPSTWPP